MTHLPLCNCLKCLLQTFINILHYLRFYIQCQNNLKNILTYDYTFQLFRDKFEITKDYCYFEFTSVKVETCNHSYVSAYTYTFVASENQTLLSKMPKRTRKSRSPDAVVRDEGPCSIRPMKVNVRRHLNLKDVLFPYDIDLFRCGGKCTFPLDTSVSYFFFL